MQMRYSPYNESFELDHYLIQVLRESILHSKKIAARKGWFNRKDRVGLFCTDIRRYLNELTCIFDSTFTAWLKSHLADIHKWFDIGLVRDSGWINQKWIFRNEKGAENKFMINKDKVNAWLNTIHHGLEGEDVVSTRLFVKNDLDYSLEILENKLGLLEKPILMARSLNDQSEAILNDLYLNLEPLGEFNE